MSAALVILTTIVWYEFLTSMSPFEMLMLVRIFTVIVGVGCLLFFLLSDHVQVVLVEEVTGNLEEVKENLAKQVDSVPVQEESEEFADLLAHPK
jgi:hypothetical protein